MVDKVMYMLKHGTGWVEFSAYRDDDKISEVLKKHLDLIDGDYEIPFIQILDVNTIDIGFKTSTRKWETEIRFPKIMLVGGNTYDGQEFSESTALQRRRIRETNGYMIPGVKTGITRSVKTFVGDKEYYTVFTMDEFKRVDLEATVEELSKEIEEERQSMIDKIRGECQMFTVPKSRGPIYY